MFNDKQTQVLSCDIDATRIKSRVKGNLTLSYLEGFDIIETANRVFGFGNWEYSITKLEKVSQELNQNQNHIICYEAIVKVTVHDLQHSKQVTREDVGFGSGIAKTLADAHENGAKEATTDGIKRALKSFGNNFGLSLYDKSRQHQNQPQHEQAHSQQQKQQYSQPNQQQIQQAPAQQQAQQSHNTYDYSSLYSLGLELREENGELIILGETYGKQDSIKAVGGFRWDSNRKVWHKQIQSQQAA